MFHLRGFVSGEPSRPVARDVVAVAAQRALELGGAVLSPPTDTPFGRSAVLADPAGAVISVDRQASLGPPRM